MNEFEHLSFEDLVNEWAQAALDAITEINMASEGWFCPSCERYHGPHVDTCPEVDVAQEGEAFDGLMKEWKGERDWMQMQVTSHSIKPTAVAYSAREGEEFQSWPDGRPYPIAAIKFDDGSIFDLIIGRWR